MLKVLEVEGAVERTGNGWQRTLQPWTYDEDRVEKVTALRRAEQEAMAEYVQTRECRMVFLLRQLDDTSCQPCGRCDNCGGRTFARTMSSPLIEEARHFVRSERYDIEPRQRWPASGSIPIDHRLQPGKALSVYGDGGWGSLVRRGKYSDFRFSDELVTASARVIRDWTPDPSPRWLTFVPSTTSPGLVADFAERLARELGIELFLAVSRVRPGRPQKEMENSSQQFGNVLNAFHVEGPVPALPVLLVDDIVDSRWTLTVIGAALLEAGSGVVYPFVLAKATGS